MFHFYTLWKSKKAKGFLTFLGGIEMEYFRPRILIVEYKKKIQKTGACYLSCIWKTEIFRHSSGGDDVPTAMVTY